MLGYTQPNNDIYIFFESGEIHRLKEIKISGIYFNFEEPTRDCLLEVIINNSIQEKIKTSGRKNDKGFMEYLLLELRLMEYDMLMKNGKVGDHQGYRHLNLIDASIQEKLGIWDLANYNQLTFWRSQKK